MAFGCILHLKSECDGCGWCEERRVPYDDCLLGGRDIDDPYGDFDDEEEEDDEWTIR